MRLMHQSHRHTRAINAALAAASVFVARQFDAGPRGVHVVISDGPDEQPQVNVSYDEGEWANDHQRYPLGLLLPVARVRGELPRRAAWLAVTEAAYGGGLPPQGPITAIAATPGDEDEERRTGRPRPGGGPGDPPIPPIRQQFPQFERWDDLYQALIDTRSIGAAVRLLSDTNLLALAAAGGRRTGWAVAHHLWIWLGHIPDARTWRGGDEAYVELVASHNARLRRLIRTTISASSEVAR